MWKYHSGLHARDIIKHKVYITFGSHLCIFEQLIVKLKDISTCMLFVKYLFQ